MEENKTEEGISLSTIFFLIKSYLVSFIGIIVVTVVIAVICGTFIVKPKYSAKREVMLNGFTSERTQDTQSLQYSLNIIDTFVDFINSNTLKQQVSKEYKASADSVSTPYKLTVGNNSERSLLIEVTITSENKEQAVELVNLYVKEAIDMINETDYYTTLKDANICDNGAEATIVISSKKTQITILGFALGIVFAVIYIFIRYFVSNRYTNSQEIEKVLGIPLLGAIPNLPDKYFEKND